MYGKNNEIHCWISVVFFPVCLTRDTDPESNSFLPFLENIILVNKVIKSLVREIW